MTKAAIITAVRNLVSEISTDSGALLDDTANLLEYIDDAMEHVVGDLMRFMPEQFLMSETVSLIAGQANYTLSASFWQVYKVERNVTGDAPREIRIINPLEKSDWGNVGDTTAEPTTCYFLGDTLYFWPTPSTSTTNYARVWLVRPEAVTIATGGPAYIPAPAHRLIVYRAAELVAVMLEANKNNFAELYAGRMEMVRQLWAGRYRSQPIFVRDSIEDRVARAGLDSTFFDREWY